jgi:hypothetical protein
VDSRVISGCVTSDADGAGRCEKFTIATRARRVVSASAKPAITVAFAAAIAALGCGGKPPTPPPPADSKDAGPSDALAVVEIAGQPLGLPTLADYGWRKRAGQPAFRLARKAEGRDDWAAVVTACQQVLAADPGHLEAAWLLAVGFAKLGKLDQILAPLQQAAAGDFAKWALASLEQPALRDFLATPTGEAWRRRVELDRERYAAAIARAAIVTAGGDLYAVAPASPGADAGEAPGRWFRMTRTGGGVLGAIEIPAARKIAYVARTTRGGKRELGLGVIDLATARTSRPVSVGGPAPIAVVYSPAPPVGFWVGSGAPRATAWRQLDDDFHFHPVAPHTPRPSGPWLDVTAKSSVRLHALPANLVADWDEQSLASAIRIGTTNRVVSVASPGLIDGNTAAWSPDRVHLAFVAQLDDHCTAGAVNTAAFVADAATGGTAELERAAGGIALQWLAERKLAIAGDHGVTIRSLDDGAPPISITGATGLMIPRERPRCAPAELGDAPADDPDLAEPSGDEPPNAGVGEAPVIR